MRLKMTDFLPKEVELETKDGIIKIKEPTIKDLIEIQKITKDMEDWKINEVEWIIEILWQLADQKEKLKEYIQKIPYSKLINFQKTIFKELGLAQNQVNDE